MVRENVRGFTLPLELMADIDGLASRAPEGNRSWMLRRISREIVARASPAEAIQDPIARVRAEELQAQFAMLEHVMLRHGESAFVPLLRSTVFVALRQEPLPAAEAGP